MEERNERSVLCSSDICQKNKSIYEKLFEHLSLDKTTDKLNVYFVPDPKQVGHYHKDSKSFVKCTKLGLNINFSCLMTHVFSGHAELIEFASRY